MIKEIAMHADNSDNKDSSSVITGLNCFLGNVHIPPTTRMLNTFNSDGVFSSPEGAKSSGKSVLLKNRKLKVKGKEHK